MTGGAVDLGTILEDWRPVGGGGGGRGDTTAGGGGREGGIAHLRGRMKQN